MRGKKGGDAYKSFICRPSPLFISGEATHSYIVGSWTKEEIGRGGGGSVGGCHNVFAIVKGGGPRRKLGDGVREQ